MALRDIKSNVDVVESIAPAVYNATETGTGVDLRGYDSAMLVIQTGTDTDGTHAPAMEESDTLGSGYTAVAAADLDGAYSANIAGATLERVGYKGSKRYIRMVVTTSGATTGIAYGAYVVRSNSSQTPLA